jgi:Tol biopolymer transport system component
VAAVALSLGATTHAQISGAWNVRVNLSWEGRQVEHRDGDSANDISPNGRYVAFSSFFDGFVPDDTNQAGDLFLHDRWRGTTQRVSLTWDGRESDLGGGYGSMSADARYISFHSLAEDLVPEEVRHNTSNVFIRDLLERSTFLVSKSWTGEPADGSSYGARMTPDARYIVFTSLATNLVPGDTNGYGDVFVRDLVAETTVRVSVATDGTQGDGDSGYWGIDISPDGRFVVFATDAVLEPGDRNDIRDIYLHDRDADEDGVFDEPGAIRTERMSNLYGPDWNWGYVQSPVIGALARHVIYDGGERIGCDHNGDSDVYGNNVGQRTNAIVSHAWRTTCTGNSWSRGPSITEDERYVAFYSAADNLIEQDGNFFSDVFLFDYEDGWNTRRISVGLDGAVPNGSSSSPVLTANGCFVLFQSRASNLIEGDTNDAGDLFVAPTGLCPAEDFNGDATVDAGDLEFFDLCLSGPADDRPQRCVPADFNRDRHVDLADFVVVQAAAARP